MNQIQVLKDRVAAEFPAATIMLDEPVSFEGISYLDVFLNGSHVVIGWKPGNDFGLSKNPSIDYMTHQLDESVSTVDKVVLRLKEIFSL